MVLSNLEDNICILTINRPDQYNALNYKVLKELKSKFEWILKQDNCRAVILTGSGNKAFIAGADIKALSVMNKDDAREFSIFGQNLTVFIEEFKIPIIAAVNGFALGGGCEFAMACHIRYASDNAVFGQPEVGLGLIAGFGGTQRLPRLIGKGRALEILLSGNNLTANEAYTMGLVNKVFSINELMPAAKKLAVLIANKAPKAIRATLKAVDKGKDVSLNEGLLREQEEFSDLFLTKDTTEGLSAFLEKRPPNFTGK